MKVAKKNTKKSSSAAKAAKVSVKKELAGLENAPFFKKKMAKANKILSITELPGK